MSVKEEQLEEGTGVKEVVDAALIIMRLRKPRTEWSFLSFRPTLLFHITLLHKSYVRTFLATDQSWCPFLDSIGFLFL